MESAQGRQVEATLTENGALKSTMEWKSYYNLWWLEWFLSSFGRNIHWSEKGSRYVILIVLHISFYRQTDI